MRKKASRVSTRQLSLDTTLKETTRSKGFNQAVKSGHCLHSKQYSGFYWDWKLAAAPLLAALRARLLGFLGRLFSVMTEIVLFREQEVKIFQFKLGALVQCSKFFFKSSASFCFFGEIKSLTMLTTLTCRSAFNTFNCSKMSGVRLRWQYTRAQSVS